VLSLDREWHGPPEGTELTDFQEGYGRGDMFGPAPVTGRIRTPGSAGSRPPKGDYRMLRDPLRVSIVVPAFNEEARLVDRAVLLNEAAIAGDIDPRASEVILVDDGSTDHTAEVARLLFAPVFPRLRILRLPKNSGKGAAVRVGTAAATAPIVAFMDADMAVDPAQIPLLLAAMDGADIAVGARNASASAVHSHRLHRVIMGRTFNRLANALTEVQLKDTQCGFKAFRTPVARILFHLMRTNRFAFDVELLSLARQLGLEIAEVPVEWRESGNSTVRPVADSMSMAFDVCRMRWRKQRQQIPALEVRETAVAVTGSDFGRTFSDAASVFRKTDPVFSLSPERAIILLPLCEADEIDGAARRLSRPATCLTVRKRVISGRELAQMIPNAFGPSDERRSHDHLSEIQVLKDRRQVGNSGEIPHYPLADLGSSTSLEV
jgi:dolichyl-phosphate beta-glucosyltransferase